MFNGRVDFKTIRERSGSSIELVLAHYLPGGRWVGSEYMVRNPTRHDARAGSFKINRSGVWSDFATGDKGAGLIDLVAYITGKPIVEAARELAAMLGIDSAPQDGKHSAAAEAASPEEACTAPTSFPERTKPDAEGKPRFIVRGEDGPGTLRKEKRRHVYRQGGVPVRIKILTEDGALSAYRVVSDSKIGWQYRRPEGFKAVPFFAGDNPFDTSDRMYWPEGEKDVETLARFQLPAFTFGGTGDGLPGGCEEYVRGRDVVILADNDEGGRKHAEAKAEQIHGVAATVRIIHFPELRNKQDVSDFFEQGGTVGGLDERVKTAAPWQPAQQQKNVGERIPLMPPEVPPPDFPVDALGSILGPAAAAIARKVQVPVAIAGQAVLATAALVTQGLRDVMMGYGQKRPISIFALTVAESGDRKSSADNEAQWPIEKYERVLREEYEREMILWRIRHAAWTGEKKKIEGSRGKDSNYASRQQMLEKLGPEPERPIYPFLTVPDPTIEGLVKAWADARPSLGLFSAEGGTFFGGHGMSSDHKLKTSAAYSGLWDGTGIRRVRAGDGVHLLSGRRLSAHLMVQPEAAREFLNDELIKSQGFHSRFLLCAPPTLAGQRLSRPMDEADEQAIRDYEKCILKIFGMRLPLAENKRNELDPPVIVLSPAARAEWVAFSDHVETQQAPDAALSSVKAFASKAAEHATRIAAVITLLEEPDAMEIGLQAIQSGIEITDFYLQEAVRIAEGSRIAPGLMRAKKLYDWMLAHHSGQFIKKRDIARNGPKPVRPKPEMETALRTLIDHGYVEVSNAQPPEYRVILEGEA